MSHVSLVCYYTVLNNTALCANSVQTSVHLQQARLSLTDYNLCS